MRSQASALSTRPGKRAKKQQSRPSGGSRGALREKAREPPVGSAASYPPEGFPLSTFGDGGLNCRVRDGTGCAPSSMAADPTGGSCESFSRAGTLAASIARKAFLDPQISAACLSRVLRRARPISTARLSTSPCLQLRPIELVVC